MSIYPTIPEAPKGFSPDEIKAQMDAFFAAGGKIQKVADGELRHTEISQAFTITREAEKHKAKRGPDLRLSKADRGRE